MAKKKTTPLKTGPRKDSAVRFWKELKEQRIGSREEYVKCAKQLIDSGAALLGYDAAKIGLRHYPDDVELLQNKCLALARARVTVEAYEVACQLHQAFPKSEESTGLLARTLKDLWEQCQDPRRKSEYLELSAKYYQEACDTEMRRKGNTGEQGYWTGINAATMEYLRHDRNKAQLLARQVLDQCVKLMGKGAALGKSRYWVLATLGEANLILGLLTAPAFYLKEAAGWYTKAAAIAYKKRDFGSLCSTLRNARLLMEEAKLPEAERSIVLNCFRLPIVVTFAGHMVDVKGREPARFPSKFAGLARKAIENKLEDYQDVIGYSSAASGGDILFLEAVQARGYDTHVFLPYQQDHFKEHSVTPGGGNWRKRFDKVLENASEVVIVSRYQQISWGSVTYDYCNEILNGAALVRAQHLECEIKRLCLWDEEPGDGPGGTASIVQRWRSLDKHKKRSIDIINPLTLAAAKPASAAATAGGSNGLPAAVLIPDSIARTTSGSDLLDRMVIKSLLFADIRQYSKLTEEHMPLFLEHFYGLVSRLIQRSQAPPVATEDRGDGVYCVFDAAWHAAHFALDFNDCMKRIPWTEMLGRDLQLRIGLHAGPVHEFLNPLTGKTAFTGTHVSRAARIEPVAPPGEVFASREFAALASMELERDELLHSHRKFTCAYVGLTEWHKDYGVEPTFLVRRRFQ